LTGDADGEPDTALFDRAETPSAVTTQVCCRVHHGPFPGWWRGCRKCAAAGSRSPAYQQAVGVHDPLLRDIGLAPYLDLVLSGDSLPRKKPDPLPLLHCAQVFGVPASAC